MSHLMTRDTVVYAYCYNMLINLLPYQNSYFETIEDELIANTMTSFVSIKELDKL